MRRTEGVHLPRKAGGASRPDPKSGPALSICGVCAGMCEQECELHPMILSVTLDWLALEFYTKLTTYNAGGRQSPQKVERCGPLK